MIHVLDCNALILLEDAGHRILSKHECMVPNDIKDEFLTNPASEAWYKDCEFLDWNLDEAHYLTEYARLLNLYGDISFFNLKGFGDIAILATISLLTRELPKTNTLSAHLFPQETICLVSGDKYLRSFTPQEFPDLVAIKSPMEFLTEI
jgi:hypothetical protein